MNNKKKVDKESLYEQRVESWQYICIAIISVAISACVTLVEIFGKC